MTNKWERVNDSVNGTSCTIGKLEEGHEYDFRVMAENQNGLSEPLETSSSTIAKNPDGIYLLEKKNLNCFLIFWSHLRN